MKEKMPYEMPEMIVMMMACEDIITSSIHALVSAINKKLA